MSTQPVLSMLPMLATTARACELQHSNQLLSGLSPRCPAGPCQPEGTDGSPRGWTDGSSARGRPCSFCRASEEHPAWLSGFLSSAAGEHKAATLPRGAKQPPSSSPSPARARPWGVTAHHVWDQHCHLALPVTPCTAGTRKMGCSQLYSKNNWYFCLQVTYLPSLPSSQDQ